MQSLLIDYLEALCEEDADVTLYTVISMPDHKEEFVRIDSVSFHASSCSNEASVCQVCSVANDDPQAAAMRGFRPIDPEATDPLGRRSAVRSKVVEARRAAESNVSDAWLRRVANLQEARCLTGRDRVKAVDRTKSYNRSLSLSLSLSLSHSHGVLSSWGLFTNRSS